MVGKAMTTATHPSLPFNDDERSDTRREQSSATVTIPEAARLLGIGRNLAYEIARSEGELAGVPVLRVGRRLLIPQARLLAVLGLQQGRKSVGE
ncbi:MAG: helix-turn-helix domain-containing protein [Acidimicrobiia bacterium]